MAQTTATPNNEVVATATKSATPKAATRRVETRDMWAVVFDHTASLLALALKGEALPDKPMNGFAFGKGTDKDGKAVKLAQADQPHIRPYMHSLLAGFSSRKAVKAINGIEGACPLKGADLDRIALDVYLACYPKGSKDSYAKVVGKAEPKQARSLVEAVIAKL